MRDWQIVHGELLGGMWEQASIAIADKRSARSRLVLRQLPRARGENARIIGLAKLAKIVILLMFQ
jgi:hypothetical protein